MSQELLSRIEGRAGVISLNRPAALHALTLGMVEEMTATLADWTKDPAVGAVIIDHAEGRGFCAGGDIAFLREAVIAGSPEARRFFHDEYRLDHLIFGYPKPVVSFIDGVTMGGGVGISQPARYRVATENTRYAMPETGIGLFPDVGGSWYLSRLEGKVGAFLALTGARLDGAECLAVGLATHYLPSGALAEAKTRIAEAPDRIEGILGQLSVSPPPARIVDNIAAINRLFAADTLEDVIAALEADDGAWAAKELATVRAKSPLSSKVALRQLSEGRAMRDFADVMRMEYRIAARLLDQPDFIEGVRAVIVDKDNAPKWSPATPEGVTQAMVDAVFAPLPPEQEWTPL